MKDLLPSPLLPPSALPLLNSLGVSVVIPVFNSEASLEELVARIKDVFRDPSSSLEIILVNDGSRDASWPVIQRIAESDMRICGLNLMRNFGQHNALLAGVRAARHKYIVTLDDDLQNPPEEIPLLIAVLKEGYDVVYGVPEHEQHGFWRDLASQITKMALQSAMGAETARNISAFRAFRTEVRSAFAAYQGPFVSIDVLLTWGTTRFSSVVVRHDPRLTGVSNYTFRKLIAHAINMMTGFSTLPLQVASMIGFGFTFVGGLVLLFVIGRYVVTGSSVPGFPFLASIIAIFSGAQLFALGIIGEYLARVHFRIMDKPSYTVREYTTQSTVGHERTLPAS